MIYAHKNFLSFLGRLVSPSSSAYLLQGKWREYIIIIDIKNLTVYIALVIFSEAFARDLKGLTNYLKKET